MSETTADAHNHFEICMQTNGCLGGRQEYAERRAEQILSVEYPYTSSGLMQTEASMAAILDEMEIFGVQRGIIEARRARRQAHILAATAKVSLVSVMDECGLYSSYGGHQLLADQLAHTARTIREHPNVTVLVHPFHMPHTPASANFIATLPLAGSGANPSLLREDFGPIGTEFTDDPDAVNKFVETYFSPRRAQCYSREASLAAISLAAEIQQAYVAGERGILQPHEIRAVAA
jgi:hypothetical protein